MRAEVCRRGLIQLTGFYPCIIRYLWNHKAKSDRANSCNHRDAKHLCPLRQLNMLCVAPCSFISCRSISIRCFLSSCQQHASQLTISVAQLCNCICCYHHTRVLAISHPPRETSQTTAVAAAEVQRQGLLTSGEELRERDGVTLAGGDPASEGASAAAVEFLEPKMIQSVSAQESTAI